MVLQYHTVLQIRKIAIFTERQENIIWDSWILKQLRLRLTLTDGEDDENYYGWFDLERFKNHIKELFSKNDREGFYSWSGLRYFLYEYELYLQDNANMKVSWEDFNKRKKEDTIEHIYPQSPNDTYWKNRLGILHLRKNVCI